jgi:transcriptional regulator with XRE-family HTH domain
MVSSGRCLGTAAMKSSRRRPNPVDIHVGSRMRSRRAQVGMSQEKLGDHLGVTFQQIQKYEKGVNRISASRLHHIARVLKRTLPTLDAAHIKSYAAGGEHVSSNGLLLRTDIHRLFDLGYVTEDQDRRFVVSRRLKEDFDNGRDYYALEGAPIRSPLNKSALPSPAASTWHRENRFRG